MHACRFIDGWSKTEPYCCCVVVVTFKLSYKTGANIMQIGALFASRQPISSNPGAILLPRLSKINITPDATVIRITVPIPSADWLYTKPIHTAMDIDAITFKDTRSSSHTALASDSVHKGHTLAVYIRARVRWNSFIIAPCYSTWAYRAGLPSPF